MWPFGNREKRRWKFWIFSTTLVAIKHGPWGQLKIVRNWFRAPKKWGFQHFRRCVGPAERENQARFSQIPTVFFARHIQRRLPLLQDRTFLVFFFGYNAVSSKSVSGAICPRESPPFRIKRRYRLCPNVVLRFFHKYLHVPVLKKRQTSLDASFSQRG